MLTEEQMVLISRKELEELEALVESKKDGTLRIEIAIFGGDTKVYYSYPSKSKFAPTVSLMQIEEVEKLIETSVRDIQQRYNSVSERLSNKANEYDRLKEKWWFKLFNRNKD